jgi:acyl-CoA thioesterase-2
LAITDVPDVPGAGATGVRTPAQVPDLLTLEAIEVDIFRAGAIPGQATRLYGGQVAAQALAAAGYTAGEARPHSLHAYFLRPGDSSRPVLFRVDRLQDGRTFRRRRVTAIQQGQPILCLESSFTTDSSMASDYEPAPRVPSPGDCPALEPPRRFEGAHPHWDLLEVRTASPGADLPRLTAGDIWFRFRAGPLPGTRSEVMITYLSDLTLAATTLRPTREHPAGRRDVVGLTSLDHSVWFHNEPDLSGWLLYAKDTPAVGGLRGLVGGRIFGQDGTLVASVAQETLVHVPKDQA